MALDFFKKVFSFGRPAEQAVEPAPEPPRPAPDVPPPPPPQEPLREPEPVEEPQPPAPEIPDDTPAELPQDEPPTPEIPPLEEPPAEPNSPAFDEPPPAPTMGALPADSQPAAAPQRFLGRLSVGRDVAREEVSAPPPDAAPARQNWLLRLREGLGRSSRELGDNLSGVFTKGRLSEEIVEELEEILIRADLGADLAARVSDALASGRYGLRTTEADIRRVLAGEISRTLEPVAKPLELDLSHRPHVILVVGVNGTGKTTTIGKLAAKLRRAGLDVVLGAGDTFRAAAIEQLKIWGERTGSHVVATKLGADAAGLAYGAFEEAKERGADVLVIDTAGRLQNRAELMDELAKIVRVLKKLDPTAPHTVLQTIDATTGQNALNQVDIFRDVAGVSGLVMTKLDGTARGGILVSIANKHRLPVYFIGVGEGVDDLEPFEARDFARAIAGSSA
ncbi:MAG TPA: signal recognition particle-docking protein FtsY [Mesorhizobium sp.]|jgi:fused signal recognition particle receptor|nr:signal recognition particle-docking protein FtsY [Mesorhizobium sp.]